MQVRYAEINIREIEESPINAQIMSDADFNRLVKNLKKDGVLTSTCLLMEQQGKKMMCISGHHRIKAAIKAGIKTIPSLIIPEIEEHERIRLQLIHNDIHVNPDAEILQILQNKLDVEDFELVDLIEGTEWKTEIETTIPEYKYTTICQMPESYQAMEDMLNDLSIDQSERKIIYLL